MRLASLLPLVLFMFIGGVQRANAQADISKYLSEIQIMAEQVLSHSEEAAGSSSVEGVKIHTNQVFELIWGAGSSVQNTPGAVNIHGWKTRWQVDGGQFDEAFAQRNGTIPPEITDVQQLGILGRGRAVRKLLQDVIDSDASSDLQKKQAEATIASLNNVIGWMKMDNGVTKGELQPRVDLTREWDSPSEFWLSTADTGWLQEVFSQAINILKVDYAGDSAEARKHAQGMVDLAKRVLEGLDANDDGQVTPAKMEGGVKTAIQAAQAGGFVGA